VPAYNEEENIAEVIRKIEEVITFPYELVVVNDHSADNTRSIVEGLCCRYKNLKLVDNPLERGFANALRTGFSNSSGDCVVPVMSDLCDDLLTIKTMREKIMEGYDLVCGTRYIKGGARLGGPRIKAFLSFLSGKSLRYLIGIPTCDIPNAFKMYRKTVLEAIDTKSKSFEISMDITVRAYYSGFKICEVPTIWKERAKGKSSFRVSRQLFNYLKVYIWAVVKRLSK
jgi:glycosyltransferase involved in cell wall biosynthesis